MKNFFHLNIDSKTVMIFVISVQKGGWIGLPPISLSGRWSTSHRSRMSTSGKAALPQAVDTCVFLQVPILVACQPE